MEIRKDIQLLRGFAVLLVVFFHLQIPAFKNGFLGVDIFFVISGFLMAKLYNQGTALDFYKRRLSRIFPAYVVTLSLALFISAFLVVPVDFSQIYEQSLAGMLFLSNVFYWNQNSYFDKTAFNPLLNFWSLSLEVQFYLLVPLIYPLLRRNKWIFLLIFILSLLSCVFAQAVSPKTAFFLLPFRIWEFLVGAWIAWAGGKNKVDLPQRTCGIQYLMITALVVAVFAMQPKPDAVGTILYGHPAFPALVVVLLTGLVIKHGIPNGLLNSAIGRLLAKCGDFSYSIYLLHFPIIVLLNYASFGGTRLSFEYGWEAGLAILVVIVLSYISFNCIENNVAVKNATAKFWLFIPAFVILSAFGLKVINLNQYSTAEKNIFAAWTDRDGYRCGKLIRIINPMSLVCDLENVPGDKKILLVGNSHADSIKKIFSNKAAELGFSTYFIVPNNPLMSNLYDADKLRDIVQSKKIKAVVLHYSNVYDDPGIRNEIIKFINTSSAMGVKSILIAPVPTYDVHVPKAMFEKQENERLQVNRTIHLERTKGYRDFLFEIRASGATAYDPSELLCPSGGAACAFADPYSRPYYFDSDHLTLTGASILKPLFQDLISGI